MQSKKYTRMIRAKTKKEKKKRAREKTKKGKLKGKYYAN